MCNCATLLAVLPAFLLCSELVICLVVYLVQPPGETTLLPHPSEA